MAGYYNFSMSNNAVEAYASGEKPLSKWTKSDILQAILEAVYNEEVTLHCNLEKLKKAPLKALKNLCLTRSSWHHTSNHYNRTDFYSIDFEAIENLTDEKIDDAINTAKAEAEGITHDERWLCSFLEWSGSRKHPKSTEITEEGIVKDNWFIRSDGSRKKTTANGFRFIKKIK